MFKGVDVTNVKTLADGTIRLTIDLLSGTGDDIKNAYQLRERETVMLLTETDMFIDETHELVSALVNGEVTMPVSL